jgi:hypothetical protein
VELACDQKCSNMTRVASVLLVFVFFSSETVTESPMGSPTARSPRLTMTEQRLRARGLTLADVRPAGRSRCRKAVPDSQVSFFDLASAA